MTSRLGYLVSRCACAAFQAMFSVRRVSSRLCIQVEAKRQVKLRANTMSSQLRSRHLSGLADQLAVNLLLTRQLWATCVHSVRPGTTEG